jgi:hypothetical protein
MTQQGESPHDVEGLVASGRKNDPPSSQS